ncbi:MAG: hypothetical protein ABF289_12825 [Clostridiales bacterium]
MNKDEYFKDLQSESSDTYIKDTIGYNDGKTSHISNDAPNTEELMIHEHVHKLSSNDDDIILRRGISIRNKLVQEDFSDLQVNEALTAYFTKQIIGKKSPAKPTNIYLDNMERMERMEEIFGKELYKKGYFQNKPELIIDKYENVMGKGKWEKFSKVFDDSLDFENLTQNQRNKADRLANKLVDKFINKSTKRELY